VGAGVSKSTRLRRVILGSIGVFTFLAVWYLLSLALPPVRLPSPFAVLGVAVPLLFSSPALASQFGSGEGGIAPHLLVSLGRMLVGCGIGVLGGVVVGLAMSYDRRVGDLLNLPTRMLRAVPPLALIPFMLVWFGTGATAQIGLIALYIFLIMLVTTTSAVRNVAPVYARFARTMGATRLQMYRQVVLPAILPELLGALRVSLAFAWGLLVVAELVGGQFGIGRVLSLLIPLLQTRELMASVLWVVVVAIILDLAVLALYRRLLRWRHA
jgi:ABC-type nitrate/sulfonate/bicarbonate transport system permease component